MLSLEWHKAVCSKNWVFSVRDLHSGRPVGDRAGGDHPRPAWSPRVCRWTCATPWWTVSLWRTSSSGFPFSWWWWSSSSSYTIHSSPYTVQSRPSSARRGHTIAALMIVIDDGGRLDCVNREWELWSGPSPLSLPLPFSIFHFPFSLWPNSFNQHRAGWESIAFPSFCFSTLFTFHFSLPLPIQFSYSHSLKSAAIQSTTAAIDEAVELSCTLCADAPHHLLLLFTLANLGGSILL